MSDSPPMPPSPAVNGHAQLSRSNSFSQQSDDSQTAADFLRDQELLEADAREALPYSIDSCTKILGPLRQSVFACLTCNPPPASTEQGWKPAGVCYACSVQCHGEHNLVEIFLKRNFTCDCGTTRIPSTSPCALRVNEETKTKGGVHSEEAGANHYNQNFRNRFCACECDYDPFQQKGTMFQCLGLGTPETGGCGEDWYHPGCLVGLGPKWFEKMKSDKPSKVAVGGGGLATIAEDGEQQGEGEASEVKDEDDEEEEDPPMPPGFPGEDDFEGFLCYKCVESNPWIKQYAGTGEFLPAVFLDRPEAVPATTTTTVSEKRKAEDDLSEETNAKRVKNETETSEDAPSQKPNEASSTTGLEAKPIEPLPLTADASSASPPPGPSTSSSPCKLSTLPAAPQGRFSLFFKADFREKSLCHCPDCYRLLNLHPQLLEEEEAYEPPLSADGDSQHGGGGGGGGSTVGSGSLLERGESALRNVDRVRAIEGVMAYNHLKEQLKPFFQQFAESGKAVGAEDIKAYFAKLRGDDKAIGEAAASAAASSDRDDQGGGGGGADGRREQSGY
ncbi:hypothetical protein CP532_5231 [Ophiocordyceps camponoti-leonardi (nom. inval.)]|nr:hypothetical protein CP532_5231 [Ophiocordyceps camponoti-leonardi (nom. inval.)]